MSTQNPHTAWKLFLETTPPNTPVEIPGLASKNRYDNWVVMAPEIQLHCEQDDGLRSLSTRMRHLGESIREQSPV